MWWSEAEAIRLSTSQLGRSSCGPTAALDVLRLLGIEADPEDVQRQAVARQRDYQAPLK